MAYSLVIFAVQIAVDPLHARHAAGEGEKKERRKKKWKKSEEKRKGGKRTCGFRSTLCRRCPAYDDVTHTYASRYLTLSDMMM